VKKPDTVEAWIKDAAKALKKDAASAPVTRVDTYNSGWLKNPDSSQGSGGTGFFYQNKKGKIFLVTNAHVFVKEDEDYFPDKIAFYVPSKNGKAKPVILDLLKGRKRCWKSFPRKYNRDVAVLEIPKEKLGKCYFFAFGRENILPDEDLIKVPLGAPVRLFGYPHGFPTDRYTKTPIVRYGIISSKPGIPLEGEEYFLIEANTQPGMSGSPVIIWSEDLVGEESKSSPFYLLGILSAIWRLRFEHSGLNFVYPASLIKRLAGDR